MPIAARQSHAPITAQFEFEAFKPLPCGCVAAVPPHDRSRIVCRLARGEGNVLRIDGSRHGTCDCGAFVGDQ